LDIQVLDDSTDETAQVANALVDAYASKGFPVSYHHRSNRHGFKAGALAEGLLSAKGEFVAIFDADFVPPADFLLKTVHYFTDPKVGMVQARWTHINRNYSFLTEVEAILLDGHFVLEHSGRARSHVFFNFNGTAGVWRRSAIDDAGGWQHDTLTEDTDLSYRAQLKGWKFLYLQDVECPAELPVEMTAFKTQQARWAKGLIQTSKKILPSVLNSDQPRRIKVEAWYHLTANLSYPLMVMLSVLLLPAMIIRFYQGWFQMLYIDLPLFMASTFSISSFYLVSQRELFPKSWPRSLLYLPFLMALGIGLTVTNTRAVLEALRGKQSSFARTPKYRVETKKDKVRANKYRKGLGWVPWVELLIGAYFALTVYYAIINENFVTVPFLVLFVIGYWYTGLMSLLQGRFSGLSLSAEAHSKPFPVGV
jgi:cellulose synthase/poly-beta-1,6-N-acetylglucosamine synthase-like glycosyltransferase